MRAFVATAPQSRWGLDARVNVRRMAAASTIRERLGWDVTPELYAKIRRLWIDHSKAEDGRDLAGLIATRSEACGPCGPRRGKAAGAQLRREGRLRVGIAVHDEGRARLRGEVTEPGEELGLGGVCGESADRTHLAMDLEVLPVDPHLFRALLQTRTERALTLIADEEQRHPRIADERLDVLDDPPAGDHPI